MPKKTTPRKGKTRGATVPKSKTKRALAQLAKMPKAPLGLGIATADLTKLAADVAAMDTRLKALEKRDPYASATVDVVDLAIRGAILTNRLNALADRVTCIEASTERRVVMADQPPVDAPYGEAERRADAPTVKPDLNVAAPGERAALCEAEFERLCHKWGIERKETEQGVLYADWGLIFSKRLMVRWVSGDGGAQWTICGQTGYTSSPTDLEAVLRQHLPYDREWREKAAKAEGWSIPPRSDGADDDLLFTPDGKASGYWPNTVYVRVVPFTDMPRRPHPVGNDPAKGGWVDLPDRASWLAFLREHAVKRDPDATPGQWVVPAEDVTQIMIASTKRIAALEAEKLVLEGTLENIRRALGGTNA